MFWSKHCFYTEFFFQKTRKKTWLLHNKHPEKISHTKEVNIYFLGHTHDNLRTECRYHNHN